MGRLVWAAAGAVGGVVLTRKAVAAFRRATPESVVDAGSRVVTAVGTRTASGLGSQLRRLTGSVQDFAEAVRESSAEREATLRAALGVDAGGLDPEEARHLLEHPTAPDTRRAG